MDVEVEVEWFEDMLMASAQEILFIQFTMEM